MRTVSKLFCSCVLAAVPLLAAESADQTFVDMAAQTDMTEAHLGQLAADQASSQAVKDYAQGLVTDHTNDYNQLTALAAKNGLTVPKGLDAKHDKMIAPFEKLKGAAFDKKYAHEMVLGHSEAIVAYTKESKNTKVADLKTYTEQTLPTLEKHKTGAQDLMKAGK